ncbi:MAG: FG-GAP repeat protein [Candidatus Neomarinimicrobiota bacterium]
MKHILLSGLLFYSGTLFSQTQILDDIDGEKDDYSGYGLSISDDGNRIAIGSEANDDGGTNAGSVRVYDYSATGWVQVGSDIIGEAAADLFGHAVSISSDGSRLAIGADRNDRGNANGDNGGHARIYEYDGTNWNQLGSDIDGEGADDRFGRTISLSGSGTRVAIGAERNDRGNGGADNGGHVRVYEFDGTSWNQLGSDLDGAAAGDFLVGRLHLILMDLIWSLAQF